MIDIHSHILPGRDDGPATLQESLDMARAAVENDIRISVATPHTLNGRYQNRREDVLAACHAFNEALSIEGIPLVVLPGAEIHMSPEIMDDLRLGRLMTLNDTGRYICLELPEPFVPEAVTGLIRSLRGAGITPIITHPEKSPAIQRETGFARGPASAGALFQIAGGSLTGDFGKPAQEGTIELIRANLVHFMASDAHSATVRPPTMRKAVLKLRALAGADAVQRIMVQNPVALIRGDPIR
ncbi:MAG: tyrosine protein phosphatase [Deltaproteobacteria bacterium]|nr:tyrosine protein phosphatase [Deltaproteobacteria bacterium]MBW1816230.1 tyrosine protein phosphatase [Deltaproteobacteria bacterium]MBW2283032.1 tyrosine protein phosphatase [Deltaproteobacteria bacterium]